MKKLLIILSILVIGMLVYYNVSYNKITNQGYTEYKITPQVNLSNVKFEKYSPGEYTPSTYDNSDASDLGVPNQVTFGDISTPSDVSNSTSNQRNYTFSSTSYSNDKSSKPSNSGSFSNMPMLYSSKSKSKNESSEQSYQIETNPDAVALTTESSIGMTDRQNCYDPCGKPYHCCKCGKHHDKCHPCNPCNPVPVGDFPLILLSTLVIIYIYFKYKKP